MGVPAEFIKIYTAPAAYPATVIIDAELRGVIRRFRVFAVAGDGSIGSPGATYALYNSAAAFVLDAAGVPTGALSPQSELYRVSPDVTVPGGTIADPAGFGLAYTYANNDATATTRNRVLYLHIGSFGAGSRVGVSMAIDTANVI